MGMEVPRCWMDGEREMRNARATNVVKKTGQSQPACSREAVRHPNSLCTGKNNTVCPDATNYR